MYLQELEETEKKSLWRIFTHTIAELKWSGLLHAEKNYENIFPLILFSTNFSYYEENTT